MNKLLKKYSLFDWFAKHRKSVSIIAVLILLFILRSYSMDTKYPFGWDQVDNAWAAKSIIVDHEFPLVGMVAKHNSGFFIGPLYYYFVAFFYWITNLNPIASEYVALITSAFTFMTIFFVIKKLFSFNTALVACFINTIAAQGFYFDSVQWPVAFLPGASLLIFYFLYKLLNGEEKYLLFIAFVAGLSFHLHFTAIFFPIIVILCLPFFPRNKKTLHYLLLSIPLFMVWFIPNLIYQLQNSSQLSSLFSYLHTYYHGFHLKRFFQLIEDGLIQFDPYLYLQAIKPLKILIIPIFLFIFLRNKFSREKIIFSYLILIFFLVPWVAFSTYKGEITDYYFSINRYVVLLILSYLLATLLFIKKRIINAIAILFIIYYSFLNLGSLFHYNDENGLRKKTEIVASYIEISEKIKFQQGVPESYIYYYFMKQKGITVY